MDEDSQVINRIEPRIFVRTVFQYARPTRLGARYRQIVWPDAERIANMR